MEFGTKAGNIFGNLLTFFDVTTPLTLHTLVVLNKEIDELCVAKEIKMKFLNCGWSDLSQI